MILIWCKKMEGNKVGLGSESIVFYPKGSSKVMDQL